MELSQPPRMGRQRLYRGAVKKPKKHVLGFIPFGPISDSLPKRLEPRTSMQVLAPPQMIFDGQFEHATRAIVRMWAGIPWQQI